MTELLVFRDLDRLGAAWMRAFAGDASAACHLFRPGRSNRCVP